jgi:histone acetyltransferase (RNA polymerase elongator complex component)
MKYKILPVFLPFSGCKNICLFCNQSNITGESEKDVVRNVNEQLHYYLSKNIKWTEIAVYGGTFTGLDKSIQKQVLNVIANKTSGIPVRVSTRPDFIDLEILQILKTYNVQTVELGIQSLSEKVLSFNKRDYSERNIIQSMEYIADNSFILGLQIMCGLYEEQLEDYVYTVDSLKKLKFSFMRIYPTLVIKNSGLEKLYIENKYIPLSIIDAIAYCAYGYIKFIASGKTVIRMGLQNTNTIENYIVAGPYHKCLGDLVKIYVLYLYLLNVDKVFIGDNEKSLVFGHSGFINKLFKSKIVINNTIKTDWQEICKALDNEDNFWILKKQKDIFEKKLFN